MTTLFPAIFIGGPPNSGKSTLVYRLRDALIRRGVSVYLQRAHPDGEGNWSAETPRSVARALRARAKRPWSDARELAGLVSRDIAARHLPLLVDAGGIPSLENEQIAAQCTHAILISHSPDRFPEWRELVAAQGLALIAELRSDAHGAGAIVEQEPTLRGTIANLDPAHDTANPAFGALVERVAQICAYDADELYAAHLALTDIELVLHVQRAIFPLPAHAPNAWRPGELPTLIGSLPPATPLGVYGIGPNWLYGALAAASHPARLALFDPRLGWVEPPTLALADAPDPARLRWELQDEPGGAVRLRFDVPGAWLNYEAIRATPIPRVPPAVGVIIDGKLPHWMIAALVRAYLTQPWVAVFQPMLGGAAVVASHDPGVLLGSVRFEADAETGNTGLKA